MFIDAIFPSDEDNNNLINSYNNITKNIGNGYGASCNITYLKGTTNSKINWPIGSIPDKFTILSLTRYTGGTRGRILQGQKKNWLHGHNSNKRGENA